MPSEYPITDMLIFPLDQQPGKLTLLSNRDHLLRRFGQLGLLDLDSGSAAPSTVRAEADRFYFVILGNVDFSLVDLREHSPSRGQHVDLTLQASEPRGVLVPFGVACALTATSAARVVELSTHSEDHPLDRDIPADELAQYSVAQ